jgi:hypothetical protein
VAEWMCAVGRPPCAPVRDEQEDLVARVGPGVGRLCQYRCGAGDDGGDRLGHCDQQVGGEGDEDCGDACGMPGRRRLRQRPEELVRVQPGPLRLTMAITQGSSEARRRLDTPLLDGLLERGVVALVLVSVGFGETIERCVEDAALAEVSRDRDGVA